MSRPNGEIAWMIFANPHCVRLSVPELGFGDDLDAIVWFCLERGEGLCTGCFRTRADDRVWIFFCFRDPQNAEDFAARFSGEAFVPAPDDLFFP
jgi:hypothetical protein